MWILGLKIGPNPNLLFKSKNELIKKDLNFESQIDNQLGSLNVSGENLAANELVVCSAMLTDLFTYSRWD